MTANAISDRQSGSIFPSGSDQTGRRLSQQVLNLNPSDFLNAVQDMTKSGSSYFLMPVSLVGENNGSAATGKNGTLDATGQLSAGPIDVMSGQTSFAPTAKAGQSAFTDSMVGQTALPSDRSMGQATSVTDSSAAECPRPNPDNQLSQIEQQIINDLKELFQLLEQRWNPTPGPTPSPGPNPLEGDVSSITQPKSTDKTLQVSTKEGQKESVAMPSDYDGTGTFSLYSDGVLAYSGPKGSTGGECYLDDSKNPPQWINYDGPNSKRPSGDVVKTWQPGDQPTPAPVNDLQGDVSSITTPKSTDKTLTVLTKEGQKESVAMPSDYDGTGTFSLYSDGVLAYSGPKGSTGGECYLDDSKNPPQWINYDGPNSKRPDGKVIESWQPDNGPLTSDVTSMQLPSANDKSLEYRTADGQWKSVAMPTDFNGTGSFTLDSNGVLIYWGPQNSVGGQCYLDDTKNPPDWVNFDGPYGQHPSGKTVLTWHMPHWVNNWQNYDVGFDNPNGQSATAPAA